MTEWWFDFFKLLIQTLKDYLEVTLATESWQSRTSSVIFTFKISFCTYFCREYLWFGIKIVALLAVKINFTNCNLSWVWFYFPRALKCHRNRKVVDQIGRRDGVELGEIEKGNHNVSYEKKSIFNKGIKIIQIHSYTHTNIHTIRAIHEIKRLWICKRERGVYGRLRHRKEKRRMM